MRDGYSGRLLEADIMGERKRPTQSYLDRLKSAQGEGQYVDFKNSLALVRETYEGDPTNPDKDLPRDLLFDLRERFGLEGEAGDRFRFYSAIGTPLDVLHGTDGWFEFINPRGRVIIATVDVTQNTSLALIGEKSKADLIIVDTEDERLVGRDDVFPKNFGEATVIYCPVSDPTAKGYIDSIDLIAAKLEKFFKKKCVIIKKTA